MGVGIQKRRMWSRRDGKSWKSEPEMTRNQRITRRPLATIAELPSNLLHQRGVQSKPTQGIPSWNQDERDIYGPTRGFAVSE
jgi:hypothetical protein